MARQIQASETRRLRGHCVGATHHAREALRRSAVGPQHDLGIEQRNQRGEITLLHSGEEAFHGAARIAGARAAASPLRAARARLASCLVASTDRSTSGAISSKRRSHTSCSTNARRSAGSSIIEHDEPREPDLVGTHRPGLQVSMKPVEANAA
ncbi:MAG: hypothetical protein U0P30_14460 [Vicinamibacterales bacterium]